MSLASMKPLVSSVAVVTSTCPLAALAACNSLPRHCILLVSAGQSSKHSLLVASEEPRHFMPTKHSSAMWSLQHCFLVAELECYTGLASSMRMRAGKMRFRGSTNSKNHIHLEGC